MKLAAAISIQAGGPGSGCRGSNCGRPKGDPGFKSQGPDRRGPRRGPDAKTFGTAERGKDVSPSYTKEEVSRMRSPLDKLDPGRDIRVPDPPKSGSKDMQQWLKEQQANKPASPPAHNLQEGDKVLTLNKVRAWDDKANKFRDLPMGFKAQVLAFRPTGKDELEPHAIIKVKVGKTWDTVVVPVKSLTLLEKGKGEEAALNPQPAPKSQTKMTYVAQDGANVTILRPTSAGRQDDAGPGSGNYTREHSLKGQFKPDTGIVKGIDNPLRRSQAFTAARSGEIKWFKDPVTGETRGQGVAGATVFVHRYYGQKGVSIQEVNTGQHGWTGETRTYQYKSLGAASNFLRSRFGIRQSIPKDVRWDPYKPPKKEGPRRGGRL